MQDDLISKKVVLDFIKEEMKQDRPNDFKIRNIERFIEDLPTAYDVEKVVTGIGRSSGKGYRDIDGDYVPPMIETKQAIDIVRNGGKE